MVHLCPSCETSDLGTSDLCEFDCSSLSFLSDLGSYAIDN